MYKPLPSPELLHKLLRYEPATGLLFWRARTPDMFNAKTKNTAEQQADSFNAQFSGCVAGTIHSNGYIDVRIESAFKAHRIIWVMVHGEDPGTKQIDHKDHDRQNNRIENLRIVTKIQQQRNTTKRNDNKSGVTGVSLRKSNGKWGARINVSGKPRHLGDFAKFEDAVAVRKAAEIKYGYHKNHGK